MRCASPVATSGPVLSAARERVRICRLAVLERTRFRCATEPVENQCNDSLCSPWSLRPFRASQCRPTQLARDGVAPTGHVAGRRDLPQPQSRTIVRSGDCPGECSARSAGARLLLLLGVHLLGALGWIRRDPSLATPPST